ncbi:Potassium efflux system KefA protein / Small-conductance mechanosensitive channel [hydrothermal vent metagenome]|uniref:Potassium efflux system KefA protein / Small-conductance mechanosensitive channel n=1 Tax=hydrothermal vent metagenome TaxID=652676 RepID=A0A3B0WQY0_9ZZZZ
MPEDNVAINTLPQLYSINIQQLLEIYVLPWGINILTALIVFVMGKIVAKVLVKFAKKLMTTAKVDKILVEFIGSIINTILLLFIVVAALDQLGVDTTSLIALIGAAGLAIGLALQGSLQNLASGVMLIIFRPFNDGDLVEAAGVLGVVEHIGIFTTTMRSGDNREFIIPNGEIFGGTITNLSKRSTRRVDMVFGIGYDDDIKKAKKIISRILEADERVLKNPEPLVAVAELADSSVNFNVRPWCKTEDYWDVYFSTHETIKLTFDAEGISIPYPQMDIHQDKHQDKAA